MRLYLFLLFCVSPCLYTLFVQVKGHQEYQKEVEKININDNKENFSIHDYLYNIRDEENTKDKYHNNLKDSITDDDEHSTTLFPDAEELYTFLTTEEIKGKNRNIFNHLKGSVIKNKMTKTTFLDLYKSAMNVFDVDGYTFLLNTVMHKHYNDRFIEKVKKVNIFTSHCDEGVVEQENDDTMKKKMKRKNKYRYENITNKRNRHINNLQNNNIVEYPGGPIRSTYGNNLSKWMKDSLEDITTPDSIKEPGLGNMLIQSLTMVKGFIQSVASSVVDIVPPLIPPPIWINRPLPCLPMITGKNCLGSILYPITAAEFITADITDSIMNGIISSFPSKYASKIGKTSETQYRICAMAYLGMYCASLFPICWLPIGLKVAETMPICFPQCLATLIACPGFWLDDIEGPCNNTSVPPFCSFSIFVNQKLVPPQLTSYDNSHSYPSTCPSKDEDYDIPDDLYEHKESDINNVLAKEKQKYLPKKISLPKYPDLIPNINTYKQHDIKQVDKCKCMDIIQMCRLKYAIPVIKNTTNIIYKNYEQPTQMKYKQKKCCRICKPIWEILFPSKNIINLKGSPVYPKGNNIFSSIIRK
ncbi:conserved Plasmodium protein, unknown function [Plasmodium sp. gorilla clade G2]|uniref:conserved Plasmodium protein, unknown function n=1 Tax=Plasmodium sp. gorilla clade G2 TaxID=880535 RepID=UPI000D205F9A|nr:conserved Plasmodium protein, unknown function [Plasmodium sp. gorilla clade G2]SOV13183.1 conserved Plasmodium protein, unknown function [Plasmodium sp. gorilla clade G2]